MRRLPSLDGLRAFSILLVITGHAYQGTTGRSPNTIPWLIFGNGGLGVEIFFVISGFIITTLLLDEHERRGAISIRNFYRRRALRIIPALWVFLSAVMLLAILGVLDGVTPGAFLSALTFTTNYSPWGDSNALAHTWSLSVEEQFYLIWPAVLVVTLKRHGRVTAAKLAMALIMLSPIIRVLTHLSGNEFFAAHIYYMLHTRMDALMFGCLLALVVGTPSFEKLYNSVKRLILPSALCVFLLSPLAIAQFGGSYLYTGGHSIEGATIAMALIWLVRNPGSIAGKPLNTRVAVSIGTISYGLYLWQELMLKTNLMHGAAIGIICTFGAAALSYVLVEKPCLIIRHRFTAPVVHQA